MTDQELAAIREKANENSQFYERHQEYLKDSAHHIYALRPEEVQKLLTHIDHLSAIIGDRMEQNDFLIRAGVLEGRARILAKFRVQLEYWENHRERGNVTRGQWMKTFIDGEENPPIELLPPSEVRVELERLKAENEKLRDRVKELEENLPTTNFNWWAHAVMPNPTEHVEAQREQIRQMAVNLGVPRQVLLGAPPNRFEEMPTPLNPDNPR